MYNTYIGIDVGVTGGISVIDVQNKQNVFVYPMPVTEWAIAELFMKYNFPNTIALIEAVHAMPKQGVTSMFTFGRNYGFLRGVLSALHLSFDEVTPQKWMSFYGLKKGKDEQKKDYKKRILQKAQNLYPQSSVALQTADSLLIADYLKRTRS